MHSFYFQKFSDLIVQPTHPLREFLPALHFRWLLFQVFSQILRTEVARVQLKYLIFFVKMISFWAALIKIHKTRILQTYGVWSLKIFLLILEFYLRQTRHESGGFLFLLFRRLVRIVDRHRVKQFPGGPAWIFIFSI